MVCFGLDLIFGIWVWFWDWRVVPWFTIDTWCKFGVHRGVVARDWFRVRVL